jgi:hypothetical protein
MAAFRAACLVIFCCAASYGIAQDRPPAIFEVRRRSARPKGERP